MRLPVRTTLLQNTAGTSICAGECDYQSERHCSKTGARRCLTMDLCDYQSERHCSKTNDYINILLVGAITSQNDTAPKRYCHIQQPARVRLPVRTTLLQNKKKIAQEIGMCDYQSERHCSKTNDSTTSALDGCDYQSERHCSKTAGLPLVSPGWCDYQSERHCSKTGEWAKAEGMMCDYQSERHCSKTQRP